ncbi:galactose-1-phosphate uridylyltransferase [Piedraia hortae CBS 480.64]|uniref:Galactose-1-phosphate uridylyltransferase n=1 Tax=Piedraia hortae CBS 480.64 TaxID=1314780 RepID=A0A6A7CAH3_9PEZI|nr:galactose-1-phosphate uridylyltransferase [Piedraia hortae CBS 480.64]
MANLNEISHRRFNPLRNSWVLVSPHRTKRPWQGQEESTSKETLPEYDPRCYLCPGNERANGERNPNYTHTLVFENDYPAVKESYDQGENNPSISKTGEKSATIPQSNSLMRWEPTYGTCLVLTFSPRHDVTLSHLSIPSIIAIINKWADLYTTHSQTHPSGYMQIFENRGSAMGCSNPHPHCQIWVTTSLPDEIRIELSSLSTYRTQHGRDLLTDYLAEEAKHPSARTVYENESFWAGVPFWAIWPFEILVVAKRRVGTLPELDLQERRLLAEALAQVTRRYDALFGTPFPYSMGIHQAPFSRDDGDDKGRDASHLHIHFYPPLLRGEKVRKFLVGYEMMAEPQRDLTPEVAAQRLRGVEVDLG